MGLWWEIFTNVFHEMPEYESTLHCDALAVRRWFNYCRSSNLQRWFQRVMVLVTIPLSMDPQLIDKIHIYQPNTIVTILQYRNQIHLNCYESPNNTKKFMVEILQSRYLFENISFWFILLLGNFGILHIRFSWV